MSKSKKTSSKFVARSRPTQPLTEAEQAARARALAAASTPAVAPEPEQPASAPVEPVFAPKASAPKELSPRGKRRAARKAAKAAAQAAAREAAREARFAAEREHNLARLAALRAMPTRKGGSGRGAFFDR